MIYAVTLVLYFIGRPAAPVTLEAFETERQCKIAMARFKPDDNTIFRTLSIRGNKYRLECQVGS